MTRQEQINNVSNKLSESFKCSKTFKRGFESGVQWADENPKSPWISVEDDLPYNHKELVRHNKFTNKQNTEFVLVVDSNGFVQLSFMEYGKNGWEWYKWYVLYWMSIPELPK